MGEHIMMEHAPNSLSPLLPGQAMQMQLQVPGKRHTSVEPSSLNPSTKGNN